MAFGGDHQSHADTGLIFCVLLLFGCCSMSIPTQLNAWNDLSPMLSIMWHVKLCSLTHLCNDVYGEVLFRGMQGGMFCAM